MKRFSALFLCVLLALNGCGIVKQNEISFDEYDKMNCASVASGRPVFFGSWIIDDAIQGGRFTRQQQEALSRLKGRKLLISSEEINCNGTVLVTAPKFSCSIIETARAKDAFPY